MTFAMKRNLLTASIAGVCVVILLAVDGYGRTRRTAGAARPFGDAQAAAAIIDRPEQAYLLWEQRGFRGRVVVSLSRRLNFVPPDEELTPPQMPFPLRLFSLAQALEDRLTAENFLLVSLARGVARGVMHVLPEEDYREKREYARVEEGVVIGTSSISAPHFGSPRVLTTLRLMELPREPVLVYLNASFFRSQEPDAVFTALQRSGLRTDFIALCRSFDDSEVTERERSKLRDFEALLAGTRGKP